MLALRICIFDIENGEKSIYEILESTKAYTKKGFNSFITERLVDAARKGREVVFETVTSSLKD